MRTKCPRRRPCRDARHEDALAAREADDGSRIPHAVALAIMDGERPVLAFRRHRGLLN